MLWPKQTYRTRINTAVINLRLRKNTQFPMLIISPSCALQPKLRMLHPYREALFQGINPMASFHSERNAGMIF